MPPALAQEQKLTFVAGAATYPPMVKLAPVAVRLNPEEREALERAARGDDRALSAMARRIIAEWLRENGFLR